MSETRNEPSFVEIGPKLSSVHQKVATAPEGHDLMTLYKTPYIVDAVNIQTVWLSVTLTPLYLVYGTGINTRSLRVVYSNK